MAEKLFEDVDQLFVKNSMTPWTSETKTIGVEIPNFLKIIEEKKDVDSPRFKFSGNGVDFFIRVEPCTLNCDSISVFLHASKADQITSVTLLEGSGTRRSWEMTEVLLPGGWGWEKFLSLEKGKTSSSSVMVPTGL